MPIIVLQSFDANEFASLWIVSIDKRPQYLFKFATVGGSQETVM